ncbi:MAG: STAS/SEC14 domain-containing protein [Thermoplasmata archaeon]|nr:MAG: STAS/SEC14 domain-containing protein [Thermoplasmata archaeon]
MKFAKDKEMENLFIVEVKGTFIFEDLNQIENKVHTEINSSRKIKLLVLAEKFSKWGKDGDWGDMKFMYEHDPYIEKIAVVAGSKWKDEMLMFLGAGRRQASVEFFLTDGEKDARNWLRT